jgi:hypothetical protein
LLQDNAYLKPSVKRPYYYIISNTVEIRSGDTAFEKVQLDYLSEPDKIELTETDIDNYIEQNIDSTEKLQFKEYICYEILRELTTLILEMTTDQRLQTNNQVTQSIT